MTDKEKSEEYCHKTCWHYALTCDSGTLKGETCEGCTRYKCYLDGLAEGKKEICKKILEEVRTNEGIEQMTKFYIGEIIKNLGVEV